MADEATRARGRNNRRKGLSFENRVVNKFKDAGILARRNLGESDGFNVGTDLILYSVLRPFGPDKPEVRHCWPVALQCKFTRTPADLLKGLQQAVRGQRGSRLWASIYGDSTRRNTTLRCAWITEEDGEIHYGDLPALISVCRAFDPIK